MGGKENPIKTGMLLRHIIQFFVRVCDCDGPLTVAGSFLLCVVGRGGSGGVPLATTLWG